MKANRLELFWSRVDKTDTCWLWVGKLRRDGYAMFGKVTIDHLCRTPACLNPEHLEPVTMQENLRRGFLARTACRRGHPWTEESTLWLGPQCRRCLICHDRLTRDRARNRSTTWHCKRGHRLDEYGLVDSSGRRQCLLCREINRARHRSRPTPTTAEPNRCANGHPLTASNTAIAEGYRRCRECSRAANRSYYQRKALSAAPLRD